MHPPEYTHVDFPQPHVERAKAILKQFPEARDLMGPYPLSGLWIAAIVGGQFAVAFLLRGAPWWAIALAAYFLGAFANHALYAMIHEATHNLVFRGNLPNRLAGLACDLALIFPGAMAFRKYHLYHHRYLGEYERDADLASGVEARVVGHSTWRKALWMALFSMSQALTRTTRLATVEFWDRWIVINFLVQAGVVAATWLLVGPRAVAYLALSTIFALGLHPLGGRWIQEHYTTSDTQETFSYYGPLNRVAFNIGYHNEHHDLPRVSWKRLPDLKRAVPEYYDTLISYRSWTRVLWNFITNRDFSPFSRVLRDSTADRRAGQAR